MVTLTARRRRAVQHLIATDAARDRLARAAFDIVAAGLDLGPIAVRSPADRAWVRAAIERPIQRAASDAIDCLVDTLIQELAAGRPDLTARILAAADGGLDEPRVRPEGRRIPRAARRPTATAGAWILPHRAAVTARP